LIVSEDLMILILCQLIYYIFLSDDTILFPEMNNICETSRLQRLLDITY